MRYRLLLLTLGLGLLLSALPATGATPRPAAAKQTFDITVSTEWQPGTADQLPLDLALAGCPTSAADTFLADLRLGLERFAAYFYRASGGQMAIGNITIHTGGVNWDQADIRVLANGSYRPTAFIGGVVSAPTAFYRTADHSVPTAVFTPAPILLSRQWDGRGARCGPWSAAAGWRTIGHEWGHRALFLYDAYADQLSGASRYCDAADPAFRVLTRGELALDDTGGTAQSLMAYHYTADQFSLWGAAPPERCRGTPQDTVYGASDWATIAQRYAAAGVIAPPRLAPGPLDAPPVTFVIVPPATPRAQTSASVKLGALPGTRLVGQAYLIRPNPADGAPLRIIGQGNLLPGADLPLRFWGVQTDKQDRAAVIVQDYTSAARLSYPPDYRPGVPALSTGADNALNASASSWQPALRITPIVLQNPGQLAGQVSGLQVDMEECGDKQPTAVEFVYCPAGGDCGTPVRVLPDSAGRTSTTFYPSGGPSQYGYIYAREPYRGAETVSWYQLGGGVGPAHVPGHAPSAEGRLQLDMAQNDPRSPNADARVLYAPAPVCTAAAPLPVGVLGIVDTPLRVQVAVGGPNTSTPWAGTSYPPLRVRLDYDQDLLDRLGIAEDQLVLLRLGSSGLWKPVSVVGQSTALDWIRSEPLAFDVQGETFALGYGPARTRLPGVRR